ncbi:MAG: LolA family protein [Streptosporangiaceae bacterium]
MREKLQPWVSTSSASAEPPDEEPRGYQSWPATLLIAPGGRYRQEYPDESSGYVIGSDGERGWVWRPQDPGPPEFQSDVAHKPPLHHLFCPSELLGGYTLEVQGPVTACGRDAIAVVATKRTDIGHATRLGASSLGDDLTVIVDAELGILLRYEETFEGQRVSLTELTTVVLDPPEAADLSRFDPPAGSRIGQDPGESLRVTFSGPGWETMKTVAGLAAGALGASIRFAPHRPGQQNFSEGDLQAAMPPAEPAVLEPAVLESDGASPLPDELLYLLYRSGENPAFTATVTEWHDLSAMTARVPDSVRSAGLGGVGYLIDSFTGATHGRPVARTASRLRVSGRDKYRVDYLSRSGKNHAKTIACDGERRWQVFDTTTESAPLGDFRLETPPGTHVTEETGNPFADAAAVMPGAAGRAIRTTADVARRTNDAVSAARSFVDDLLGRSRS